MFGYNWVIENKELLKVIYGLIILLICFVIVVKTHKLFRLSLHQGIRYFRNAFLFYGLAFLSRYILGALATYGYITYYTFAIKIFFEFFLVMAGFFLLYSLLWKKMEPKPYDSSLFNPTIFLFYLMTFVVVALDYLWWTYYFMFLSQILLFIFTSGISYVNYQKNKGRHKFIKFYFASMVLSLLAWILNSALEYFEWSKGILINIYFLNIIFFLLFLWGVIKITSK